MNMIKRIQVTLNGALPDGLLDTEQLARDIWNCIEVPTDAMWWAGIECVGYDGSAQETWKAMHAAALEEPKRTQDFPLSEEEVRATGTQRKEMEP